MFLRNSEKKGLITLSALIIALFILPQAMEKRECPLFLLTPAEIADTNLNVPVQQQKKILAKIELNTVDSATLIKIRGIGPYYATKIIKYREKLGGFYTPKQLKEIKFQYLDIDTLLSRFSADGNKIHPKDLDTMNFKGILHHPYLEYEDVQLIFSAKRKFGKINFSILESEKILPVYKLKKIKPYFK